MLGARRGERTADLIALSWDINRGELLSVVLLKLLGHSTLKEGIVSDEHTNILKEKKKKSEDRRRQKKTEEEKKVKQNMKKETADRKGEMKTREKSRLTIKDIVELAGRAREQELACDLDLLLSTDVSHLVSQRSLKRKFKRRRRKCQRILRKEEIWGRLEGEGEFRGIQ